MKETDPQTQPIQADTEAAQPKEPKVITADYLIDMLSRQSKEAELAEFKRLLE